MDLAQEKQLVIQAKQSLEAFDALYRYYLPKIYGYVMNRTGNKEITEDIVSQTFITAMLNLKKYQDKGVSFGAWLYRIAHNTFVDYFRKNKSKLELIDEKMIQRVVNEQNEYEQIENKLMVQKALLHIPEQYQQILSLKYFEEMDNQEIADILGIKKETLAVKLHRSLEALKKVIDLDNAKFKLNE